MQRVPRLSPFVLLGTNHGSMIVNRFDYHTYDNQNAFGVGCQILANAQFDPEEVDIALSLLGNRLQNFGAGVVAIDCGANIGVHTIEWAKFLAGTGHVYSFEPQEKIFYALAGNIVLNNCLNVTARHAAVGAQAGSIQVPQLDYTQPASFGSLELNKREGAKPIGQNVDYTHNTQTVPLVALDDLNLPRVDFIKIDVEGMELDVLKGAERTIAKHHPSMLIEYIKAGNDALSPLLTSWGYKLMPMGVNLMALHQTDPQFLELQARMQQAG